MTSNPGPGDVPRLDLTDGTMALSYANRPEVIGTPKLVEVKRWVTRILLPKVIVLGSEPFERLPEGRRTSRL